MLCLRLKLYFYNSNRYSTSNYCTSGRKGLVFFSLKGIEVKMIVTLPSKSGLTPLESGMEFFSSYQLKSKLEITHKETWMVICFRRRFFRKLFVYLFWLEFWVILVASPMVAPETSAKIDRLNITSFDCE